MLIFFLGTECLIDNVLEQNKKRINNILEFKILSVSFPFLLFIALRLPILKASYNKTNLLFGKVWKRRMLVVKNIKTYTIYSSVQHQLCPIDNSMTILQLK